MKELPEGFDVSALPAALTEGWGIVAVAVDYAPVGFGSYHWIIGDRAGRRNFVTVDDLDRKPWLGATREEAVEGLRRAYGAAIDLRHQSGLDFVVAPVPTGNGDPLVRIGSRHTLSVFPLLDGRAGHFGDDLDAERSRELVLSLASLHQSAQYGSGSTLARVAGMTTATADGLVVTHGEPHPGNILWVDGRPRLVDWDTVALAPPERDLWLVGDPEALEVYASVTGHVPDEDRLAHYRLAWDLSDVASFVAQLRSPHQRVQDTEESWTYLLGTNLPGDVTETATS